MSKTNQRQCPKCKRPVYRRTTIYPPIVTWFGHRYEVDDCIWESPKRPWLSEDTQRAFAACMRAFNKVDIDAWNMEAQIAAARRAIRKARGGKA